ncbi:MAG: acyl-CoA dehydrogenase [Desulfarculaceae bacterium]|nr:acyl-CoA dehydrogenase [Desulfarculaceae bacterium]MCF8071704.1 acyl-CoA dehydrogenase [Desulfarculaceae bacterium]MCF8102449.1 acyl-CoA dehydrogenase [Desulfarculaceae bacterium]MCF8116791.1 acyl-CoA dehydrogenase [Desulfarculaceae bacterium]
MGVNYFRRDTRDSKFLLLEHLGLSKLLSYPAFADFSQEDVEMMLEEGLKVGREVLGPGLQDGDRVGCAWDDGVVTTPDYWKECWRVLAENGWTGATSNPEFGGQGLPLMVGGLIRELHNAANMAFMTFPGLAVGAGHLIENYGTDQDRALFVEKMYTGVWAGTMCLTENDAGSDVGASRTKAVPDPDSGEGVYRIEGTKRFITCGEHDLCENIIHLTLARIEGAPAGTKGLSLFIVPKIWVEPDGSLGQPNDMFCSGIEHKMGIHGSPTCSLSFGENGGCRGILLGEPHSGMAKMFQMMNEARIGCGIQACGVTASAYDAAKAYARERVQGAPLADRHGEAVTIVHHEDVRRMLMNLKAGSEAMRALVAYLLFHTDVAKHDPDPEARQRSFHRMEILTPLVKAYNTDFGYMLTRDAIQVLGGSGYCSDFPVEQYARDIKILSIWEGTNYIQSLDLVGRKLGIAKGSVFKEWIMEVMGFAQAHGEDPDFGPDFALLGKAAGMVGDNARRFTQYFQEGRLSLVPLYATRFLENFAETVLANLLLEQGLIARDKLAQEGLGSGDKFFYQGKMASAKFFCRNVLTNVFGRYVALQQEDTSALEIPEEAF